MKKFKVTLYREIYEEYEVEAETEDEAGDMALSGDEAAILQDVSVKESEVLDSTEISTEE